MNDKANKNKASKLGTDLLFRRKWRWIIGFGRREHPSPCTNCDSVFSQNDAWLKDQYDISWCNKRKKEKSVKNVESLCQSWSNLNTKYLRVILYCVQCITITAWILKTWRQIAGMQHHPSNFDVPREVTLMTEWLMSRVGFIAIWSGMGRSHVGMPYFVP